MHAHRVTRLLFTLIATGSAWLPAGLPRAHAADPLQPSPEAIKEAEQSAKMIKLPKGFVARPWAAEPLLENPVAFHFDEKGRAYIAETYRVHTAILDSRGRRNWPSEAFKKTISKDRLAQIETELLNGDLAAQTIADREKMIRTYFVGDLERFTAESEVIKRVVDKDGDGVADEATLFADGFNQLLDGTMSGVLARKGEVYATNIPSVWRLFDRNDDGVAEKRELMSTGYGVRWAFFGHDMHGLRIGPDGRLYFSIGDRGAAPKTREGQTLAVPETGAVFRCELDGSHLELFAKGLRNPQELAFDELGNMFTGDNSSDGGDKARVVYVVEGGDSGWRQGLQYLNEPRTRGPWLEERWSFPRFDGQAAFLVPPLYHLTNGPSGLTYHPGGDALPGMAQHFFLVDFRGQATSSGVWSFQVKPRGAGFEVVTPKQFAWGVLATDVDFGPDGALYVLDWVTGWAPTGKGRLHRITRAIAPSKNPPPPATGATVAALLASDLAARARADRPGVVALLGHADARVRQEAQFALADGGDSNALASVARDQKVTRWGRLHALWGLGQMVRRKTAAGKQGAFQGVSDADPAAELRRLLGTNDGELRGQAARALADGGVTAAGDEIARLLADPEPRARFFAGIALGKLRHKPALPALQDMLAANADRDPFLRHAGFVGLAGMGDKDALLALSTHRNRSVRLAAVVALRRLTEPRLARFLKDADPGVAREAAIAINDELSLQSALPELAALAPDAPPPASAAPAPLARTLGDDAICKRVVHANTRLGNALGAARLTAIAGDTRLPIACRRDAVLALADWAEPLPRNRVTGVFQPFAPARRDPTAARTAFSSVLPTLFVRGPAGISAPARSNPGQRPGREPMTPAGSLATAAADAATRLGVTEATPLLAGFVRERQGDARSRLAVLRTLDALDAPEIPALLPDAARDPEQRIRLLALRMRVKREPQRTLEQISSALRAKSTTEQQTAISILAEQKSAEADTALLGLLDSLLAGKLAPELSLDLLEAAAGRDQPAFKERVAAFDAHRPKEEIGGFVEAEKGGDYESGRRVFEFHAQVQCRRCHSIEGHGELAGPDLQTIGRRRDRKYLLEAIVFPSKHFAPGFESLLVTMKSGAIHGGTLKRERPGTLELETVDQGRVSLAKKQIAERERGVSAMPEGFGAILSKRELRDVVEFLVQAR